MTLFFVEIFKTLDVNFVQKCHICVENENLDCAITEKLKKANFKFSKNKNDK